MTEQQLTERLRAIFEHLHDNPEVSWEEVETTKYLMNFLKQEGLDPVAFNDVTGLYVDIGKGTPEVGFRTDIDALWQQVNGKFQANHSCGHDGHMTVALGVVLLLREIEDELSGAVRIIFQPAEEKLQGAKKLVELGVVDNLKYLYGTHVRPLIELDDGKYSPALHHGGTKFFSGKIEGIEAHGARPEEGINGIEVAAALIDGLKRMWFRPSDSVSIKMTKIQAGGSSANIIPGSATFTIDARAQTNEMMDRLTDSFESVVSSVSATFGASIDYKVDSHIAAAQVDNTAKKIMEQAIVAVTGKTNCASEIVTPGGEDFHLYTFMKPKLKTTMLGIGSGVTPGLHHPDMTFNQERLPVAAEIVTNALVKTLEYLDTDNNKPV